MSTVRLEPSVQSVALYPLRYRTVPILKTFVDDFFNHENIHCQQREMTNTSQSRNNWSRITSICQKKKNNYVLIMRQFETNHKKAFGTVYTVCIYLHIVTRKFYRKILPSYTSTISSNSVTLYLHDVQRKQLVNFNKQQYVALSWVGLEPQY